MERLDYDRGKLLKAAALGAFGLVAIIYVWLNPDDFAGARKGRWMATGFGRTVILPLLAAACATLAWRASSLALGNLMAVEFTASHLHLNAYWGMSQVRWADVAYARIESNMGHPQLCVATHSGGLFGGKKIRLALALTEAGPVRVTELVKAIESRALSGSSAPAAAIADHEQPGSGFDPDAAIARYLAQRTEEGSAAAQPQPAGFGQRSPSPAPAPAPQRPSFGRKGL